MKISQFSWFSRFPPFGLRKSVRFCMHYNVFLRVRGRRGRSRTHGENPWKTSFFMKIHENIKILWNCIKYQFFMKIVVSRPSPRRDPRNILNYCSILQVPGTRIGGISWICIFFLKIHNFHDFLKKAKNLIFRAFYEKTSFRPTRSSRIHTKRQGICRVLGRWAWRWWKSTIFTHFHGIS